MAFVLKKRSAKRSGAQHSYSKFLSLIHYFKPKKHSPSGMVIKFGNRGVGKSTDLAKYYYQQYKKFKKGKCPYTGFYSNVQINGADPSFYHYMDLNKYQFTDFIDPYFSSYNISTYLTCKNKPPFTITTNSFICCDELGIICGNRDYKNFPKQWTNYVKLIRHFGVYLVCYSQAYDIDKSLRTAANELYLMRKIGNLTISRKLLKQIKVDRSDYNQSADEQLHDSISFGFPLNPFNYRLTYIPFYTDLFNSFSN